MCDAYPSLLHLRAIGWRISDGTGRLRARPTIRYKGSKTDDLFYPPPGYRLLQSWHLNGSPAVLDHDAPTSNYDSCTHGSVVARWRESHLQERQLMLLVESAFCCSIGKGAARIDFAI